MRVSKRILFCILFIFLSSFVLAVCPQDPGCLDLNNIGKLTPDQASKLTLEQIGKLTPEQVSKLTPTALAKLTSQQFSKLTSQQISKLTNTQKQALTAEQLKDNLGKLGDLTKYKNVIPAIKSKYGVAVKSLGKVAKFKDGVLRADFGKGDSFDFSGKKEWEIEIDENGIVKILKPKVINEGSISASDQFTISELITFKTKDGFETTVQGLSVDKNKFYIRAGDSAVIGNYKIPKTKNVVNIYFNQLPTSFKENYISFVDYGLLGKGISIGSVKGGIVKVEPQPGNKLFDMTKRKYEKDSAGKPIKDKFTLVADERAEMAITVSGGDRVDVNSRKKEGKTPLINHIGGQGQVVIDNGRMSVKVKDGKLMVNPPKAFEGNRGSFDMRNSVAFELVSDKIKNQFLRTSSSNRYEFMTFDKAYVKGKDFSGKALGGTNMDLTVSNLIADNMFKTIDDLRVKYPKINFLISGFGKPLPKDYTGITANLAQITNQWLKNKEGIENLIPFILFDTESNAYGGGFIGSEKFGMGFGERLYDPISYLTNPVRNLRTPLKIPDHELIHVQQKYIINVEIRKLLKEGILTAEESTSLINYFNLDSKPSLEVEIKFTDLIDEGTILFGLENEIVFHLTEKVFKHPKFAEFEKEFKKIDQKYKQMEGEKDYSQFLQNNMGQSEQISTSYSQLISKYLDVIVSGTDQEIIEYAHNLMNVEAYLRYLSNKERSSDKLKGATNVKNQLQKIIEQSTGGMVSTYFGKNSGTKDIPRNTELITTYSELPPATARKVSLEAAQLEYDRVYTIHQDIKKKGKTPPEWLLKDAEKRYYDIMGGKSCPYKTTPGCGPCLSYTTFCKPPLVNKDLVQVSTVTNIKNGEKGIFEGGEHFLKVPADDGSQSLRS